jgi:membrane-associated phospholipid phosphatase
MSEALPISPEAAVARDSRTARSLLCIGAWLLAIGLAAMIDAPVARFMRNSGVADFLRSHQMIREALKAPGFYGFTLAAIALVTFIHPLRWRAGLFVFVLTTVSGVNALVKWGVGRARPFKIDTIGERLAPFELHPFRNGWAGLFEGKNLCFPSGHACLAFATAAALVMLWPRARWRWVFWVVAALVATERFAENAHWLSDCVAAAALGVGGAKLLAWGVDRLIRQWKPVPTNSNSNPTSR